MLGQRIKEMREASDFTQDELAALVGTTRQQIWKYEADKQDMSTSVLDRIAKALKTTPDYLLGYTDDPTPQFIELTAEEKALLKLFRQKSIATRRSIIAVAREFN